MGRVTSDEQGGQVTEIEGRGEQFWEFPGCELVEDFSPSDWLRPLVSHRGGEVRSWVPEVFDAYARVFYPIVRSGIRVGDKIVDRDPPCLRWADVATRNGWTVHAEMAAEAVVRPAPGRVMDPDDVDAGNVSYTLDEVQFGEIASILARHTRTPNVTWFGLWEGYGDLMVGLAPAAGGRKVRRVTRPRVLELPDRNYLLYRAPVPSWSVFRSAAHAQVPDLWWPEDRSWFLATDTDFRWLYVGGTHECIAEIVASKEIEALATVPGHCSLWVGSDSVNDPHRETLPE